MRSCLNDTQLLQENMWTDNHKICVLLPHCQMPMRMYDLLDVEIYTFILVPYKGAVIVNVKGGVTKSVKVG